MMRVHVLVEGQTEETFVKSVLQAHFHQHETYLFPRLMGKPGHKGGIGEYPRAGGPARHLGRSIYLAGRWGSP